jgi:hypothetical protein
MSFGNETQLELWGYAMKNGYLKFAFDQGYALNKIHNPFVKSGVCNAMSYDWIKRGLCGAKVTSRTYQNIPVDIASMQMGLQSGVKSLTDYAHRDGLTYNLIARVANVEKGALFIGMNIWKSLNANKQSFNHGFAHVGFAGTTGGHAVAFRLAGYRSLFFDPNFGECKFPNEDEMRKFWNQYSEKMYWSEDEMHSSGFMISTFIGVPHDAAKLLKQETMFWL